MTTKTCYHCGREFPATLEFFYRHHRHKLDLSNECRECSRERNRKVYQDKRDAEPVVVIVDRMIAPASREPHAFCYCDCYDECRELVQAGRQVLCGPIFDGDELAARAYQARREAGL